MASAVPTPRLLQALATCWAERARGEREAEARFAALARSLGLAGAPEEVQALALRASVDEARHGAMCARLARTYGARVDPGAPRVAGVAPQDLTAEQAALAEVV